MMTAEQLKNSILEMAMQGKLVEQRPEEGTGEELYKKIQAEKKRLLKEGSLKKQKPLSEITEEEMPFDIPESWKWAKLGDISSYAQPKEKVSPKDITSEMWSLDLEDIEKGTGKVLNHVLAHERKIQGDKVRFKRGNILYSKLRPYLLKILIADNEGITTPELVPFNIYGIKNSNFFLWYLRSPYVDNAVNSVSYGVKMPRVGTDTMVNLLVPLPPLEEQKRIVAKIEELMPFVEQYAAASTKLNTLNATFPDMMKKSILQEAVQGKLVPQDPNDEPASVLLKKIAEEKKRLVKEGKIKKEKEVDLPIPEELPFELPESWQWVRFGVISNIVGTGLVRSNAEQSPNKEYSYFKMNNIGNFSGECDFSEMTKIDASIIEVEKYKVEENDFLFNTRNSRELVGKTAVVPKIDGTVILNNNILKIRFFDLMDPWYINYYFISDLGRRQLNAFITNTTNVAAIYQKQLVTLLVPIPPLEEQHRIVKEIKRFDPFLIKLKESIGV